MERPIELTVLERDLQAALIAFDPASKPAVLSSVFILITLSMVYHHLLREASSAYLSPLACLPVL